MESAKSVTRTGIGYSTCKKRRWLRSIGKMMRTIISPLSSGSNAKYSLFCRSCSQICSSGICGRISAGLVLLEAKIRPVLEKAAISVAPDSAHKAPISSAIKVSDLSSRCEASWRVCLMCQVMRWASADWLSSRASSIARSISTLNQLSMP